MLITFIRTIIIYVFVIVVIRLMGKRQIGELEPSELVVTIIISEVAAMPIQDSNQPIATALVAIFLLLIMEIIVSFGAFKNRRIRKFLYGTPSILFEKGKINQAEMEKQRFNVNDIMEIIRNNGVSSLDEVDYVIVETNGNVSILPKASDRPVTIKDLKLKADPVELSYIIVENGKINMKNLKIIGFDEKWLMKKVAENSVGQISEVFCMGADRRGEVFVIKKEKK